MIVHGKVFGQILDRVLEENLALQKQGIRNKDALSTESWLTEYCTVQLGYGRCTGKTTAIADRASSSDLVIVCNGGMVGNFNKIQRFNPVVAPLDYLISRKCILAGKKIDRIWVDDASYAIDPSSIMDIAISTRAKQIILIG